MEQRTEADRVVLITGAASGIGRATAQRFARAGAFLALIDWQAELLLPLALSLRAQSVPVNDALADLRDVTEAQEAVDEVLAPYGRVDVVFANVGQVVARGPFATLSLEEWQAAFQVNLLSHVATLQACLPYVLKAGGGCIITNCSDQALRPEPGLSAYAAAKAALLNLTYALATEWAAYGIRVNALAAGMTRTPLLEAPGGLMDQYAQEQHREDREEAMREELRRRGVLLGRLAEPEEIAEAVYYLASARFCTGMTLRIDGGHVRSLAS